MGNRRKFRGHNKVSGERGITVSYKTWFESFDDGDIKSWWDQYGRNRQSGGYPGLKNGRNACWKEAKRRGIDLSEINAYTFHISRRPRGYGLLEEVYENPAAHEVLQVRDKLFVWFNDGDQRCCHRNGMLYGWSCGGLVPGRVRPLPK